MKRLPAFTLGVLVGLGITGYVVYKKILTTEQKEDIAEQIMNSCSKVRDVIRPVIDSNIERIEGVALEAHQKLTAKEWDSFIQ